MNPCCCGTADDISTDGWNITNNTKFSKSSTPFAVSDGSEAYIADALLNMSLEDRDKVYHEVHGVADVIEETPQFLAAKYDELKLELQHCCSRRHHVSLNSIKCDGFLEAEAHDRNYVHSIVHYKIFLRAERFDAKLAAMRMIRFFEFKRKNFSSKNLCMDITQDMLSREDLKAFKLGFQQLLPVRDSAGRSVSVGFPDLAELDSLESLGRIYMYAGWIAAQDEETQRKGQVFVVFRHETNQKPISLGEVRVAVEALAASPVRLVVLHHCFGDVSYRTTLRAGLQLLDHKSRAKHRVHFGTAFECVYELMSFGIPDHAWPIDMYGEMKLKPHLEFIKTRKHQEEWIKQGKLQKLGNNEAENNLLKLSEKSIVILPANQDVLLGRGKRIHSHRGNTTLRTLVDAAIPAYEALCKAQKTQMSQEIVRQINNEYGGRFLKLDDKTGIWLVVDDETARLKVSHLFRARRDEVLAEKKLGGSKLASVTRSDHPSKRQKLN